MVSCDICIDFRLDRLTLNQPDICSGDQLSFSLSITNCLSSGLLAKTHNLGRLAHLHALLSASSALYHRRPRFLFTSREIVDGDLCSLRAIARILILADKPALISSRSALVRWMLDRFLVAGFIPPCFRSTVNIDPGCASSTLAISLKPAPCFHKSKTRSFS